MALLSDNDRWRTLLRWPLPALFVWGGAWVLARALQAQEAPSIVFLGLPTLLGAALAQWPLVASTGWRRIFVSMGFPLSLLAMGQGGAWPAWLWLIPLGLLLLAYPVHAWRDAPVFPTPDGALAKLPELAPLPSTQPKVLDAGCGLGNGLKELHAAYPQAKCEGVEWSWLWWAVAAMRCPWASLRRGDMWADDWSRFDLVYLFQRPETMPRAMDKARAEMRPGCWLVSLEFEAASVDGKPWSPHAVLTLDGHRPVWIYRL